ncbi:MAG TPA: FAD binding domain-containing protein [Tepidisphaeraceae bacterium]|nr:FAD binding domain-containing protein [Tepidisphaeraceae bacterium]
MNAFEWADACSIQDVFAVNVKGSAIKAGGVDLVDLMKEGIANPARVINIRNIAGLNQINMDAGVAKIGPLATLSALAEHAGLKQTYTALAQAAAAAATPQIRNMATVGGNLLQRPRCWYFRNDQFACARKGGDLCYAQRGENQYHAIFQNGLCAIVHPSAAATPLVAMNATIELTGPKGKREMPLEEFFVMPNVNLHAENKLEPDEILTEIRIPALQAGTRSHYVKQAEMESHDWPIAEAVAVLQMDDKICKKASIVLGAAAPTPRRATEVETAITGKEITAELARSAAKAALRRATPMTQNRYKLAMFEAVISRAIMRAAAI